VPEQLALTRIITANGHRILYSYQSSLKLDAYIPVEAKKQVYHHYLDKIKSSNNHIWFRLPFRLLNPNLVVTLLNYSLFISRFERLPAPARSYSIRVVDGEAAAHAGIFKINLYTI
jgi:hypothetical protein